MSNSPHDNAMSGFGPNEWLVDEMHERYLEDPSSVDEAWQELFKGQESAATDGNGRPAAPTSKPAPQQAPSPAASEDPNPAAASRPAPEPAAVSSPQPTPKVTEPKPNPAVVTGSPATSSATAARNTTSAAPTSTTAEKPVPKDQPRAGGGPDEVTGPERVPLRGAAARTAANMDLSLSVPTATSVRSVPVKLLIDNRVVINNHLARARGGKVSFTHIIGFALVKALREMPAMNVGFEVVDDKPTLVRQPHINLGLAIDVAKSDGSRQLLVPSIKAAESMGFAEFWSAYEDVVRRTRDNKLGIEDFQGTTVSLTNPGTIGTVHSVPRLMSGPGLHHRRRGDGVPD